MIEVIFRGKRVDTGEWVQGYYFPIVSNDNVEDRALIVPGGAALNTLEAYEIDRKTLGQVVFLTDDNVYLFNGDLCRSNEGALFLIMRDGFDFRLIVSPDCEFDHICISKSVVLGNMWDDLALMDEILGGRNDSKEVSINPFYDNGLS